MGTLDNHNDGLSWEEKEKQRKQEMLQDRYGKIPEKKDGLLSKLKGAKPERAFAALGSISEVSDVFMGGRGDKKYGRGYMASLNLNSQDVSKKTLKQLDNQNKALEEAFTYLGGIQFTKDFLSMPENEGIKSMLSSEEEEMASGAKEKLLESMKSFIEDSFQTIEESLGEALDEAKEDAGDGLEYGVYTARNIEQRLDYIKFRKEQVLERLEKDLL